MLCLGHDGMARVDGEERDTCVLGLSIPPSLLEISTNQG